MIKIKTKEEIKLMRKSGQIAAEILKQVKEKVAPGVTTQELNELADELIFSHGVRAAFRGQISGKNGEPFPAVMCTSVNSIIVHGAPSDYKLQDGDVVGLDFGVVYEGYYSDLAVTVPVGNISDDARRLLWVTKKALKRGIKKVRPGNTIGDIGNTIQRYVESQGYGLVRDLVGHGVGKSLHEDPSVPNYGKRGGGEKLREGMVIAIEPMVVANSHKLVYADDKHGFETKDRGLAAHFEHTVAVTERAHWVLTEV